MNKMRSMLRGFVALTCAAQCFALTACDEESFQKNPLCASCIESACTSSDAQVLQNLVTHFETASDEVAAQLVSRTEAFSGCVAKLDSARVSALYAAYPESFYDTRQPYAPDRASRAVKIIAASGDDAPTQREKTAATAYLVSKVASLQQDPQRLAEIQSSLEPLASQNDEAFELLAVLLKDLTSLEALPETEARNRSLVPRYTELTPEIRSRVLKSFVSATWHMQQSGSTLQPQRLELDWQMLPLPQNTPPLAAYIKVKSVSVKNDEAQKRGVFVRDQFADTVMRSPDRHRLRVDLGPWLKTADAYRIAASAELSLWSQSAPDTCFTSNEGCDQEPIAVYPVKLDFTYRAYSGVETGAPTRYKNADDNTPTSRNMRLSACNESECTLLWDGKVTDKKSRKKLDVVQGHDFYLHAQLDGAKLPVAGRLMARTMPGATWQEVATFFSNAPSIYAPGVRANIDVSQVCRDMGACSLELQLRPSLRMARRDPSVTRYWGDTLELGTLPIEIKNRTSPQVYKSF